MQVQASHGGALPLSLQVMTSKPFTVLLALCAVAAVPAMAERPKYNLVREKGATYVRDVLDEKDRIQIKVLRPTNVYLTKDARNVVDVLRAGRPVDLEAFTRFAYRVRGMGTQGMVVGWVNPRDLEAPPPGMLDNLRKMVERREQVDKLIAAKQVALGMTTDEVAESRGRPTKRSHRLTAEGRTDVWEYIEYENIPQYDYIRDPYTGALFKRFSHYVQIEKGKITVDFQDGVVTALSGMEDLRRKRDLAIVPAPLNIVVP